MYDVAASSTSAVAAASAKQNFGFRWFCRMSLFCALQACGWCPLRPSCLRSALSFPQQAISTSAFLDYMKKLKYDAFGGAILSFSIMISVSAQNRGGVHSPCRQREQIGLLRRLGRHAVGQPSSMRSSFCSSTLVTV